jgi:hypothetical protein
LINGIYFRIRLDLLKDENCFAGYYSFLLILLRPFTNFSDFCQYIHFR